MILVGSSLVQAVQRRASSTSTAKPSEAIDARRRPSGPTGFALERSAPTTTLARTSRARTDHSSAGSRAHGPVHAHHHQPCDGVDRTADCSDPMPCSEQGDRAGHQEHEADEEGHDQTEAKAG